MPSRSKLLFSSGLLALLWLTLPNTARGDNTVDWSFSGDGVTGSGVLSVGPVYGGMGVTSISGTFDGMTLGPSALLPQLTLIAGFPTDNFIYSAPTLSGGGGLSGNNSNPCGGQESYALLDSCGVGFVLDGVDYVIYAEGTEYFAATNSALVATDATFTAIFVPSTTPEPGTAALLLTGPALMILMRKHLAQRRTRSPRRC